MTTFWTHLQHLARGQLFNGGYLRGNDAAAAAARTAPAPRTAARTDPARGAPHAQLAACA